LEEEIYMEIPTGYKEVYADPGNDKVLVLKGQQATETPSTPGFHVVRNIPEAVFISDHDQKLYRSGVGMLLFLVKHT